MRCIVCSGIYPVAKEREMSTQPALCSVRWGGRPRTTWMKNVHDDLSSLDLGIHEAEDLARNRPLCRLTSLHSATHS